MSNHTNPTQYLLDGTAEIRKTVEGSVWTELFAELSGTDVIWTETPGFEIVLVEGEIIEVES